MLVTECSPHVRDDPVVRPEEVAGPGSVWGGVAMIHVDGGTQIAALESGELIQGLECHCHRAKFMAFYLAYRHYVM